MVDGEFIDGCCTLQENIIEIMKSWNNQSSGAASMSFKIVTKQALCREPFIQEVNLLVIYA